jgi:hypothetical protein
VVDEKDKSSVGDRRFDNSCRTSPHHYVPEKRGDASQTSNEKGFAY